MSFLDGLLKAIPDLDTIGTNVTNVTNQKSDGCLEGVLSHLSRLSLIKENEKTDNRIAEESSGSPPQQKEGQKLWKCYAVCSYFTYTPSYEAGICSVDGAQVEILKNCKWGYRRERFF